MTMQRRSMVAGCSALLGMPYVGSAHAQSEPKVARLGFLSTGTATSFTWRVDAMKAGLSDLGYVDGKNLAIEYRYANFDNSRLPALAADLVRLNVDVVVTVGTPPTLAAMRATSTIPIVMTTVADAVASGIVANLARPDANITGVTFLLPQLSAKRIQLLVELNPKIHKVAALQNGANTSNDSVLRDMEAAARLLNIGVQRVDVKSPNEFENAFSVMRKDGVDAVVVNDDTMLSVNAKVLADLALLHRFASAGITEFAEAGGLMAYGISRPDAFRRTAYFVDKIIRGAKPRDLPVELPTKFEMIINKRTATELGIRVPNAILIRADRAIE